MKPNALDLICTGSCCLVLEEPSFESLFVQYIKNCLLADLDPLQFAYRTNRSTEDAISTMLHLTLSHLEQKNYYAWLLFIDFSSTFNTIIQQQLVEKLGLQLFDSATADSRGGQLHIKDHHIEHRLSAGLRPEPSALHPARL